MEKETMTRKHVRAEMKYNLNWRAVEYRIMYKKQQLRQADLRWLPK